MQLESIMLSKLSQKGQILIFSLVWVSQSL